MISSVRTSVAIAEDALESLRGARETLQQLEALFNSLKRSAMEHSGEARLAALGSLVAMDQANGIDCLVEDWQAELCAAEVAMRNIESESLARTSAEVRP